MKRAITLYVILSLYLPRTSWGAACCLGGSPKSFVTLQRLESYEVAVSTSFRDVYGYYNVYGDLDEFDKNQTLSFAVGVGVRLSQVLEASLVIPWVYQQNQFARGLTSRNSIGDLVASLRYTLIESTFLSDWFPTVSLIAGAKTPTGTLETYQNGRTLPGTGNGIWEPFIGIAFQKEYGFVTLGLNASYTLSLKRDNLKEGNKIELIESAAFPFSRRLNVAVGAIQNWVMTKEVDGQPLEDSAKRVASVFVSPTFFLNQFWLVTAGAEFSIPAAGFGVNQQAYQNFSVTTKYGFF